MQLAAIITALMYDVWMLVTLAAASDYYSALVGLLRAPTSAPTITTIAIRVTSMINLVKL